MLTLDALDTAVDAFRRHLAQVSAGQWAAATPCDDWDVHYLVAHVVGGNRFAALVLAGMPADSAIGQVMAQRQIGTDPSADYESSATSQRSWFRGDGVLDTTISHPLGTMAARRFLELRVFDITLHAWDLACALEVDPSLDPSLVGTVLDIVSSQAEGMGFGITPLGEVGQDATDEERLLDLTGRRKALCD